MGTSDIYQNWTNATTRSSPTKSAYYKTLGLIAWYFSLYFDRIIHGTGIMSNTAVLLTMLSTPQLRGNSSGILIIALAIADFLLNILSVVISRIIRDRYSCYFLDYSIGTFTSLTQFIMVLISVNRYALVCHPMKHQKVTNNKSTIIQVVGMAIFSLLCSIFLVFLPHAYNSKGQRCFIWLPNMTYYYVLFYGNLVTAIIGDIVPMLVTTVLTVLTIVQLRRTGSIATASSGSRRAIAQRNITKALLGIGIIFVFTGLPFRVSYATYLAMANARRYNPRINVSDVYLAMRFLVSLNQVNHTINFFVYMTYHTRFRTIFLRIMKCQCNRFHVNED